LHVRIEPKAFIAIEQSMAGAMCAQWDRLAAEIVAGIHDALQAHDYAKAQQIANRLTMEGVVKNVRPRLEELAVSALLFGAHGITGDVRKTIYAKGQPVPATLHTAITQLEHAVEVDAADYVRQAVHALIEEQKRADERAHMQKHDIYTEPDKLPYAQTAEELPDAPDPDKNTPLAQAKLFGQAKWQYPDLKKDGDISDEQLAETGGLQEPEQGPNKRKRKAGEQTLYVKRPLKNADDLIAWAKANGFDTTLPPDDMHVTVCYSKALVDWDSVPPKTGNVTNVSDDRSLKQFGDAVVLAFDAPVLEQHHDRFMDAGGSHDYPSYQPHVTITYQAPEGLDLSKIEPYDGLLIFGPEEFKPIKGNWKETIVEKAEEKTLAEKINDAVVTGGKVSAEISASLTTSRLISLGFLSQASSQGVTRYRVDEILDDRTCPICAIMHGKEFNVVEQMDRTVRALSTQDPADLKTIMPWPTQSEANVSKLSGTSNDDLQAAGYGAPPYHARCRGLLTEISEEVEDFNSAVMDLAQQITEGLSDGEAAEAASAAGAAEVEPSEAGVEDPSEGWDDDAIEQLGWKRFDVTDPVAFAEIDQAYEDGDYDKAKQLLDDWTSKRVEKAEHAIPPSDDQRFDGPNVGKKNREPLTSPGREQDYEDIRSDSSSIAFGARVINDANAPLHIA
jgi:hypothetical protein